MIVQFYMNTNNALQPLFTGFRFCFLTKILAPTIIHRPTTKYFEDFILQQRQTHLRKQTQRHLTL